MQKGDKLGIGNKIETACLKCLELSIESALIAKNEKHPILKKLQIQTEILKRLIRLMHELDIIKIKDYLSLQKQLQEISKMANGWIKYLQKRS